MYNLVHGYLWSSLSKSKFRLMKWLSILLCFQPASHAPSEHLALLGTLTLLQMKPKSARWMGRTGKWHSTREKSLKVAYNPAALFLNVSRVVVLCRYGMGNRLGDACHRKDSLLHIVSKRKRHEVPHQATQGHVQRYQGCSGGEAIRKKCGQKPFLWFLQAKKV